MNATNQRFRRIVPTILGVIVALLTLAVPASAHAGFIDIAGIAYEGFLDIVLELAVTINTLLGQLFAAVSAGLNWVLSLEITTQLTAIGITWTIIRDICNLVFIVVFIGIAFGTIFNATGLFKGWHYKEALMPLLVAAILMNFSLAIGKTAALASNAASKFLLNINKDPGGLLIKNLSPNNLNAIDENARNALDAKIVDTVSTRTTAENTLFQKCLTEEKTVVDTNENALFYTLRFYFGAGGGDYKTRKSAADCNLVINDARYGTTPEKVAAAAQQISARETVIPKGDTQQKIMYIADSLFKILMMLMLISCLLSAFVFLALRIIVVWVLLAISPIAFASYAIPGGKDSPTGLWQRWKTNLIAWNVFGPLYLLSLIPGMVMLGASGEMLLQFKAQGADIGTAGTLIQQFFFYGFAVLIFVGGLALSLKSSYAGTIKTTDFVGGLATKFGVFQEGTAKFGQAARLTGVKGAYESAKATGEAAGAKLKQVGTNIGNRIPGADLLRAKSYEQRLAEKKSAMGVYGGAEELTGVYAKNVKAEETRLQQRLSQMPNVTKKDKDARDVFLRGQANSSNTNVALAAREMLLRKGDSFMNADEIKKTTKMYPNADARRAFEGRVKTAPGEAVLAKKKEAQAKRENIVATVGLMKPADVTTGSVKAILDPYFPASGAKVDEGEKKAYIEALGLKDPSLLYEYLQSPAVQALPNAGTPANDLSRAYAPIIGKPENALDWPEEFYTATDPASIRKVANLKAALDSTYTPGSPRRGKARDRLLVAHPEHTDLINRVLFP